MTHGCILVFTLFDYSKAPDTFDYSLPEILLLGFPHHHLLLVLLLLSSSLSQTNWWLVSSIHFLNIGIPLCISHSGNFIFLPDSTDLYSDNSQINIFMAVFSSESWTCISKGFLNSSIWKFYQHFKWKWIKGTYLLFTFPSPTKYLVFLVLVNSPTIHPVTQSQVRVLVMNEESSYSPIVTTSCQVDLLSILQLCCFPV